MIIEVNPVIEGGKRKFILKIDGNEYIPEGRTKSILISKTELRIIINQILTSL